MQFQQKLSTTNNVSDKWWSSVGTLEIYYTLFLTLFVLAGCVSPGLRNCTVNSFPPNVTLIETRNIGCLNWTVAKLLNTTGYVDDIEHLSFFSTDSLIACVDSIRICNNVPGYENKVILLHIDNKKVGEVSIMVFGKEAGFACTPHIYVVTDSMVNLSKEERKCLNANVSLEPWSVIIKGIYLNNLTMWPLLIYVRYNTFLYNQKKWSLFRLNFGAEEFANLIHVVKSTNTNIQKKASKQKGPGTLYPKQ